jgi:hypothetical protein
LLRIVGENAYAVDALIDHAVEHTPLPRQIDLASVGEWRRRNRKDAAIRLSHDLLPCGAGGVKIQA